MGKRCFWIPIALVSLVLVLLSTPHYPAEPALWLKDDVASKISNNERHRILLLTAHPDDECMFFAPTTLALTSSIDDKTKWKNEENDNAFDVYSLCLSSGNADGLGEARKRELGQSLEILRVPRHKRWILDEPFKDNIKTFWDAQLVAEYVKPYVLESEIDVILTFDQYGISSHPNHISLERGVRVLLKDLSTKGVPLRAFSLRTTALLPKYAGPASALQIKLSLTFCHLTTRLSRASDLLLALLPQTMMPSSVRQLLRSLIATAIQSGSCTSRDGAATFVSGFAQYTRALQAMRAHRTQLVWFRWLYVSFSRYMWVNDWLEIVA